MDLENSEAEESENQPSEKRAPRTTGLRLLTLGGLILLIAGAITYVDTEESVKSVSTPETTQTPPLKESRHTLGLGPGNPESLRLAHSSAPLDIPVPIEMRKSFAREKRLPVLDLESLDLDISLIELLELTPTQIVGINESLRSFMQSLRTQELAHAFVSVDPDGNEEIVVSAFDRTSLLTQLQAEISVKGTPDIADFLIGQLAYDRTLGVNDAEIRVAIETGNDGADRVSFTRRVRRSNALDDKTPIVSRGGIFGDVELRFSPTDIWTTKGLLSGGIGLRLKHLFEAAPSLPTHLSLP